MLHKIFKTNNVDVFLSDIELCLCVSNQVAKIVKGYYRGMAFRKLHFPGMGDWRKKYLLTVADFH
jgi:hypothetical protein